MGLSPALLPEWDGATSEPCAEEGYYGYLMSLAADGDEEQLAFEDAEGETGRRAVQRIGGRSARSPTATSAAPTA
jgi:hypothetical protein